MEPLRPRSKRKRRKRASRHRAFLLVGLRQLSRIRVRSVVGRFLEHSRIFVFGNGGQTEVYLGSADWMPRNLYERVEVIFRLKDPSLCHKVCSEILLPYFADTEKARFLMPAGQYIRTPRPGARAPSNGTRFNVQDFFMDVAESREPPNDSLPPQVVEALQASPFYEALSAKWDSPEAKGVRLEQCLEEGG